MRKKTSLKDIAVIGLALFAMFFGAGNLIFPPYLGTNAGSEWFIGFMCFFIADVGLALVAILSMIKGGDVSIQGVTKKLGAVPSVIINTLVVLCIGPFLAIPRTAATTFEMGVMPIFPKINSWIFGAVFFGLVLLFTVRPSGVVDVIGKYLTPILVICLMAMTPLAISAMLQNLKQSEKALWQAIRPWTFWLLSYLLSSSSPQQGIKATQKQRTP